VDNTVILINATGLGYQVLKALHRENVKCIVIYDRDEEEIGHISRYVAKAFKIPGYIEEPLRLLDFLLKKAPEWSGMLLIPTKDHGVEFLARYKYVLGRHYVIPTPPPGIIERIMNKKLLYSDLKRRGIGAPDFLTAASRDELDALKDSIRFPCLLKPGRAHAFLRQFGYKMLEIRSFDELARHYSALTRDFTKDDYDLMICEIIPGPDKDLMVQYVSYIDESGELLAWMTSRKMRQDPPNFGQARVARSEKVTAVDWFSRTVLRDLGYFGFSEIEWKYDLRDETWKIIEINTRFIFYLGLCTACGINFPYIQYADLVLNEKVRVDTFRENVYWIHEYKDFLHSVLNHRVESISPWQYVRPYLGNKSLAIFDLKDPIPFLRQIKEHADNAIRRRISGNNFP
jgi:D-aspartate ligase